MRASTIKKEFKEALALVVEDIAFFNFTAVRRSAGIVARRRGTRWYAEAHNEAATDEFGAALLPQEVQPEPSVARGGCLPRRVEATPAAQSSLLMT